MSGAREILTKINSIKNIQKITRAMELVATNKMRKAFHQMENTRPYTLYAKNIINHIMQASMEYIHPYFKIRKVKKVGIVVISTDQGMCGSLNINLFKKVLKKIINYNNQEIKINLYLIGVQAKNFFKKLSNVNIISLANFNEDYSIITDSVSALIEAFQNNKIDNLKIFSNRFVNTIKQRPKEIQLLPIINPENIIKNLSKKTKYWDYIYEPEALKVLNILLFRYIESQISYRLIENFACEQSSRRLAMKNATDNANNIIKKLNLDYNKKRQDLITKELIEIVSGAEAV